MSQVTAETVGVLEDMNLQALREVWRARWGAPPTLRSVELLRLLLGWRIQAAEHGGLDPELRRRLKQAAKSKGRSELSPGTIVGRQWQGVTHEVEVLEEGFGYAGRTYRSLSEIAREITGSRWNGPRFFGLRGGAG